MFISYLAYCGASEYKMQTTSYDVDSIISVRLNTAFKKLLNITIPRDVKSYTMLLSFLKTDIDISEEISLNQFSDFISSVGGNLGLFIGFSFLSALLTMVEWLRKMSTKLLS